MRGFPVGESFFFMEAKMFRVFLLFFGKGLGPV
jgi:hypothetical protein